MTDDVSSTESHLQETARLKRFREQRLRKIDELRARDIDPYPPGPVEKVAATVALALPNGTPVTVAGRVMLFRLMGNIAFLQLRDESGNIQIMLSRHTIEGEDRHGDYKFLVYCLDVGDIIAVDGERFETKTGEQSVNAQRVTFLAKSLLPLPDKHAGVADPDVLLRKRYLDILLNDDVRDMIYKKARFWRSIREYLEQQGFVEVQTPALELTTGGADARPFVTYHNYLGVDVRLRISMGELWQKRLLVAGLEKVFEIGRQFRNESQSREHLNDYDQMEFYWAYADYEAGMKMVEDLFRYMAVQTFGKLAFQLHRNGRRHDIDLEQQWTRYDYVDTVERLSGMNVLAASTENITAKLDQLGVAYESDGLNRARVVDALWKYCRRQLSGPGFLVDEPVDVSPLAKRHPRNPALVQRFHVIIAGSELGNGYGELNDPVDQAERFAEQERLRAGGDEEAQMTDNDFVEALQYGMPPACGFGMSERVFAFFMDKSVRECQIFPLLKPQRTSEQGE